MLYSNTCYCVGLYSFVHKTEKLQNKKYYRIIIGPKKYGVIHPITPPEPITYDKFKHFMRNTFLAITFLLSEIKA